MAKVRSRLVGGAITLVIVLTLCVLIYAQLEQELGITILNVKSQPRVGSHWSVNFTTQGIGDLRIQAQNSTTWDTDIEFKELRCGNRQIPTTFDGVYIIAPNFTCQPTATHVSYVRTSGQHTQRFIFGEQEAFAYNHAFNISTIRSCGQLDQQGIYNLSQNITFAPPISGISPCIAINASNVTLDCIRYNITYSGVAMGILINNGTRLQNITIRNCNIQSLDTGSGEGSVAVTAVNVTNLTLWNNTIKSDGVDNGYAIFLQNVTSANISNNNISTGLGSITLPIGILISHNSNYNNIYDNEIFINISSTGSGGVGVEINGSDFNNLDRLWVNSRSAWGYPLVILNSVGNNVSNSMFNATIADTGVAQIIRSKKTLLQNVTLDGRDNAETPQMFYRLFLWNSLETYINATTLLYPPYPINATNDNNGTILWSQTLIINNYTNLTDIIKIENNRTSMNTSDQRGSIFAKNATIILNTTATSNEKPYVAIEGSSTFVSCPSTRCGGISFDSNSFFLAFNVTNWSSYSSGPMVFGVNITFNTTNATAPAVLNITYAVAIINNGNNQTHYNFTIQNINNVLNVTIAPTNASIEPGTNITANLTIKSSSPGTFNITVMARGQGNGSINTTSSIISSIFSQYMQIDSCQSLNTSNTAYNLTQAINQSDNPRNCFSIGASNVTLNCNNLTVNYGGPMGIATGATIGGHGFTLNNVTVMNCRFNATSPGSDPYGIWVINATNVLITNNTILTRTGDRAYGIFLEYASGANVTYNHVTTSTIYLGHVLNIVNSSANNIEGNDFRMDGTQTTADSFGIILTESSTNTFRSNNITTDGSTGNIGVYINKSGNNSFVNNRIKTMDSGSHGLKIEDSRNNSFQNLNITLESGADIGAGNTYAIRFINSNETWFNNTQIMAVNWLQTTGNNTNFTNTSFLGSNGRLDYKGSFTYNNASSNITAFFLNFTSNKVHVDSRNHSFLNQNATLSFTGISFNDPRPTIDMEGDGSFTPCSTPDCFEIDYTNGTFRFNVTHFTDFSTEDAAPTVQSSGGGGGSSGAAAAAAATADAAAGEVSAIDSASYAPSDANAWVAAGTEAPTYDSATIAAIQHAIVISAPPTYYDSAQYGDQTQTTIFSIQNQGKIDAVFVPKIENAIPQIQMMSQPAFITTTTTGMQTEAIDIASIEKAFQAQIETTGESFRVGAGKNANVKITIPPLLAAMQTPITFKVTALSTEGEKTLKEETILPTAPSSIATAVVPNGDKFAVLAVIEGPNGQTIGATNGLTGAVVGFMTGAATSGIPILSSDITLEMNMKKDADPNYRPTLKLIGLLESVLRGPKSSFSELFGPYDIKSGERVVLGQQFSYQDWYNGDYQVDFDVRAGNERLALQKHNITLDGEVR